jgi:hypothetical protein
MRHMPVETLAEEILRVACFNDQKLHFIASEADDTRTMGTVENGCVKREAGHADWLLKLEQFDLWLNGDMGVEQLKPASNTCSAHRFRRR